MLLFRKPGQSSMSKGVQGPAYIGKLKVGKQQFTGNYEKSLKFDCIWYFLMYLSLSL